MPLQLINHHSNTTEYTPPQLQSQQRKYNHSDTNIYQNNILQLPINVLQTLEATATSVKANVIAVKATEIGGVNAKKCFLIHYYYIL